MIEKFKETYLRIIVKNVCYVVSAFLLTYLIIMLEIVFPSIDIIQPFIMVFYIVTISAMYFIVKGEDYAHPWRYLAVTTIVYIIVALLWFYLIIYPEQNKSTLGFGDALALNGMSLVNVYIFAILWLVDICFSIAATVKNLKAKKAEAKIPAQENVTSENDFPPEVQAD
ncbi:MAG: hypothetical protein E7641_03620 [Ruminococcaceae bacterium]|nr:hypothetical protein [Oscillospiraceae bacterium]